MRPRSVVYMHHLGLGDKNTIKQSNPKENKEFPKIPKNNQKCFKTIKKLFKTIQKYPRPARRRDAGARELECREIEAQSQTCEVLEGRKGAGEVR